VDAAGNIFFSDKSNYCIRVIYAGGPVVARLIYLETGFTAVPGSMYTIAGIGGQDGSALAPNNVLATSTKLFIPTNMAIDANDNVYFMEISKAVRKISAQTGLLSTLVGNGSAGYAGDGGLAVNAELFLANGIALDNLGNLYVVDGNNYRIRKVVLSTGVITTVAGTGIDDSRGTSAPPPPRRSRWRRPSPPTNTATSTSPTMDRMSASVSSMAEALPRSIRRRSSSC
jgi:hypothetical protein